MTAGSKYEEAAKEYASHARLFQNEHSEENKEGNHAAKMRHFLAGASFAEKEEQNHAVICINEAADLASKEAHNAAIDKAIFIAQLNCNETTASALVKELEKLKI